MQIIKYKDADEENFVYAICDCLTPYDGIEIERPVNNMYISFTCPRCGRNLGIYAVGKTELKRRESCYI